MPALDLVRPPVTAIRVIASVNTRFAHELKLPPHIRSLRLILANSDDVAYIAADETTKQAMVEVVYGRSLYAGAAHGPSPTADEVLIMSGGLNPVEMRAGLGAMVTNIENDAAFQWANDTESTAFLAHVVSRTGSYLSSTAGITLDDPVAYLVAPPLEATYGIDVALRSTNVQLVTYTPPPSETSYSAAFLTGSQATCRAVCNAFTDAMLGIVRNPTQCAQRRLPMIDALGLLEVDGMVVAMDAADTMLKAANARLLSHEAFDPGCLTLVVGGDLMAYHAALDVGCAAATRTGRVISRKETGRPDDDTQWLVTGLNRQPKQPVEEPGVPVIVAESADELLALLVPVRQGMTTGEVAAHFGCCLSYVSPSP